MNIEQIQKNLENYVVEDVELELMTAGLDRFRAEVSINLRQTLTVEPERVTVNTSVTYLTFADLMTDGGKALAVGGQLPTGKLFATHSHDLMDCFAYGARFVAGYVVDPDGNPDLEVPDGEVQSRIKSGKSLKSAGGDVIILAQTTGSWWYFHYSSDPRPPSRIGRFPEPEAINVIDLFGQHVKSGAWTNAYIPPKARSPIAFELPPGRNICWNAP